MNGTDLVTLNVYGSCGEPPRESVGIYSYPRDIETVKARIEHARASRIEIAADLPGQGFELPAEASLVPIFENTIEGTDEDANVHRRHVYRETP